MKAEGRQAIADEIDAVATGRRKKQEPVIPEGGGVVTVLRHLAEEEMSAFSLDELPGDFAVRLVKDCPDAIVYADAAGVIRFWNDAATRIFGYDAGEALGASLDLIVPQRLRPRHWRGFDEVMRGRQSRYGQGDLLAVPALHKNGRQISVEFTILPFRDSGGSMIGIAALLRDDTKRFEEMRALRRELSALRADIPKTATAG
jgi:PAS domain S-box-containing protein